MAFKGSGSDTSVLFISVRASALLSVIHKFPQTLDVGTGFNEFSLDTANMTIRFSDSVNEQPARVKALLKVTSLLSAIKSNAVFISAFCLFSKYFFIGEFGLILP